MHRQSILDAIHRYRRSWLAPTQNSLASPHGSFDAAEEARIALSFEEFIKSTPRLFERDTMPGHVTGSAMLVTPELDRVLLTLHGKLNKWLQLGGHSDGDPNPHEVALREAEEESGLPDLDFLRYESIFEPELSLSDKDPPLPFDYDVHMIPARPAKAGRPAEPEHYHFDVRYIVVARDDEQVIISDESQDLRWFSLADARTVATERSMLRQFDKLLWLKSRLS